MAESTKPNADKSIQTLVSELWTLLVRYAKQETVDPLKSIGRYLVWGLAGSVLLAAGLVLLALAGLRALQQEIAPHLSGNWSWAPYLVVVAVAAILVALLARAIFADKRRVSRERMALRQERR